MASKDIKQTLRNSRNSQKSKEEDQVNDFLDNSANLVKSKAQFIRNQIQNALQTPEGQEDNQNSYRQQYNVNNKPIDQNLSDLENLNSSRSQPFVQSPVQSLKSKLKQSNFKQSNTLGLTSQGHQEQEIDHINQSNNPVRLGESQNKSNKIKEALQKLKQQLSALTLQRDQNSFQFMDNGKRTAQIQQQIQVLEIKLKLHKKLSKKKQFISMQRINHIQLIFKHYCTHIFKTGKHMTFDRLQYQKVHLTIDRLCAFLKDFSLTSIKMKDGKTRQIIQKQQIIRSFKKISSNCKDLDFQQFIIIIQKLGQIYFDSKINYDQRKDNQRKQKLKIKQVIQKKQKLKDEMLRKYKQKQQKLEKGIQSPREQTKQRIQTHGGQNDDVIQSMINQDKEKVEEQNQQAAQQVEHTSTANKKASNQKTKKSRSTHNNLPKYSKKQPSQKNSINEIFNLSRQQKIQYFYDLINVDDVPSFSNKMRELNLPLFKIYGSNQNLKNKDSSLQRINQQKLDDQTSTAIKQSQKVQNQENKRLKQLRSKLNQRNQKLKHASTANVSLEDYEQRKLNRSKIQGTQSSRVVNQRFKAKKIDITESEINLSSLSKLAYDNINFSKFNPKSLYSRDQDDDIFMKQYADSPVKARNPTLNVPKGSSSSKISRNTNRIIEQKDKNSQNFLRKLKDQQSKLQINQKKQQVSQLYRFNDRTQRQKRLIDKFLQKNK